MAKIITDSEYKELVLNASKPVLVDFFADWCGPCKMMAPIIEQLSTEAATYDVYKMNIDNDPAAAASLRIMSIPTLILFKDGAPAKTIVGFHSKSEILEAIAEFI